MGIINNLLLPIFIIISLVFIYKKREDEEKYLALKVVGYYLLGSFRFNFNSLVIPLGFALYLIFFRPTLNKRVKKLCATFGFIIFCVGIVIPSLETALIDKSGYVKISSTNIDSVNFVDDLNAIKEKFNIKDSLRTNEFRVNYDKNGEINEIILSFIDSHNGYDINYYVNYGKGADKYYINKSKSKKQPQLEKTVDLDYLIKNINNIKNKKIDCGCEEYSITLMSKDVNYNINDKKSVYIDRHGNEKQLNSSDVSVNGILIWHYGEIVNDNKPGYKNTSNANYGDINYILEN